ncbi:MAG: pyridoxamine 5'-phosphate oxidase [Sphingomonadales bacterium]|nr:pyridoxamine 5'-phosphate oxidase [Sphingomonadales bacterium]
MASSIAELRKEYTLRALIEGEVHASPIEQFTSWWNQALESKIEEVNAMALSTLSQEGLPESRIVLLKGYSAEGFIFFTNYQSSKGTQLQQNAHCSLLFFWKELERQVRISGKAKKISEQESDAYFNSRPEGSKIGAWASPQSSVVESQEWLTENFEKIKNKYTHTAIPRPSHWGGFIVQPAAIEFWQGRPSRMHDRIRYSASATGEWKIERLAP